MADNLALALKRQRAFVADASHELRNPLATLRLRIEALAGRVDGDGERDLRLALCESDRLAQVVDRLLELARAEATAAERVEFDVVALARQRLVAWEPALAAAGSTARLADGEVAASRSSPEALEYTLDVLLDNARKFAPGGEIEVAVAQCGGAVVVTVRDDGPGLSLRRIWPASGSASGAAPPTAPSRAPASGLPPRGRCWRAPAPRSTSPAPRPGSRWRSPCPRPLPARLPVPALRARVQARPDTSRSPSAD